MQVAEIKRLAEAHSAEELLKMADCLENEVEHELHLDTYVQGSDEGERLTHVLGALWIREQVQENGTDLRTELRNFSQKVRTSIDASGGA